MYKLMASLYLAHWSPMVALRLVYRGSRSMRWAALEAFWGLVDVVDGALLVFMTFRELGLKVVVESVRLRAAGSISGMLKSKSFALSGMHLAGQWSSAAALERVDAFYETP